jgi:hypothetical protein
MSTLGSSPCSTAEGVLEAVEEEATLGLKKERYDGEVSVEMAFCDKIVPLALEKVLLSL